MGAVLIYGCENVMRDMYDQPKYKPLEKSEFFPDEQSARPLVAGTIARAAGGFASPSSGREGIKEIYTEAREIDPVQGDIPFPLTLQILRRGQERYNIYCTPCHGMAGYGNGKVVRRGFPPPPSYHSARLRSIPDSYFYNVITQGFGHMFSHANRVEPRDRWAIVAYIRALQLSQNIQLSEKQRRQLLEVQ
ncbi:c-type cytochrome [Nitrosococcus wardiae]|uniref:Cytochrome c n=1 Tax=Nitrosococcus wardiae TaxID=1814290 RepID=A0A4P7BZW6_9GAMM|nr:cytochrome c [Nitrosococcus wardiae]QBQ54839.1 cytochrome c [Nitrosococcus wardiae]